MKIQQICEVKYGGVYAGWNSLDITDADGSEVKIKMTEDQWLDLKKSVDRKCKDITSSREKEMEDEIAARVESQLADVENRREEFENNG